MSKLTSDRRDWRAILNDLRRTCSADHRCYTALSVPHLTKALADAQYIVLAERLGQFAGFALLETPAGDDTLHMSTLFALSAGRAIVEQVVQFGTSLGKRWLTIDSTIPPVKFYLKLGFYFHAPGRYTLNPWMQSGMIPLIDRYATDLSYGTVNFEADVATYPTWNNVYKTFSMVLPLSGA